LDNRFSINGETVSGRGNAYCGDVACRREVRPGSLIQTVAHEMNFFLFFSIIVLDYSLLGLFDNTVELTGPSYDKAGDWASELLGSCNSRQRAGLQVALTML
jgi:hypothetical protein